MPRTPSRHPPCPSAPARHPMPGVDPLAPHPREGKGLPGGDTRWRKGLLRCLLPVWQRCAPLPDFPAQGPCALVLGGGAVPAGPGSLLPVPCAGVGTPPPAPRPAHPAVPLLLTLRLAPKSRVPLDEELPGLSGGPPSPGSGGGPSPGHSGAIASQQPPPRAGPCWLGNAVYISLYFFLLCNLSMV